MNHFSIEFILDDDGFLAVACNCGWRTEGLPDNETAIDVFGEHCYAEGYTAGALARS